MSQELDCDVAVIGAGIIDACIALELAERGLKVFIFDPESPCSKTSYGNAGVISPWTCVPQSMPGLWRQIPNWLADPDGPVSIRPGYFPKLLPWALRFFSAGRENRIDQIGDALFALSQGSVNAYKKRLKGTGYDHIVHDALYVHVYKKKSSASLDHRGWIMRRDRQVPVELIDRETLKKLEPEISQAYNAAIIIKNQGRAKDPARIGTSIMKKAFSCRARHLQKKVNAIQPDHGNGCKIITDDHEYKSNNIVIAAGVWSKRLLQNFGFTVPLEAEQAITLYS